MPLIAFLTANALLAVVLLVWNLVSIATLRLGDAGSSPDRGLRWDAGLGVVWNYGAATAAIAAVGVGLGDLVLFGSETVAPVAAMFSLTAVAGAVAQALASLLLGGYRLARGLDLSTPVFGDNLTLRRSFEWATATVFPLALVAALITGLLLQAG